MHDEFRYPDRPPPTPTSSVVLWLMASVVLAGSVVLGLALSDRDAGSARLASRSASPTGSELAAPSPVTPPRPAAPATPPTP